MKKTFISGRKSFYTKTKITTEVFSWLPLLAYGIKSSFSHHTALCKRPSEDNPGGLSRHVALDE